MKLSQKRGIKLSEADRHVPPACVELAKIDDVWQMLPEKTSFDASDIKYKEVTIILDEAAEIPKEMIDRVSKELSREIEEKIYFTSSDWSKTVNPTSEEQKRQQMIQMLIAESGRVRARRW